MSTSIAKGVGGGGTPGSTEPGAVSTSTSGAVGTATEYARADHSHDLGVHAHTDSTNGGAISGGGGADVARVEQLENTVALLAIQAELAAADRAINVDFTDTDGINVGSSSGYDFVAPYVQPAQAATGATANIAWGTEANYSQEDVKGSFTFTVETVGTLVDRTAGTAIGGMTAYGGLAAAFDGVTSQAGTSSAVSSSPQAGYVNANAVGKDWGSGVTRTITSIKLYGPNDQYHVNNTSDVGFKLQGSTDNFSSSIVDLYTGTLPNSSSAYTCVASGIVTTTAYRYHRVVIGNPGSTYNACFAEVQFYESASVGSGKFSSDVSSSKIKAGCRMKLGSNEVVITSITGAGTGTDSVAFTGSAPAQTATTPTYIYGTAFSSGLLSLKSLYGAEASVAYGTGTVISTSGGGTPANCFTATLWSVYTNCYASITTGWDCGKDWGSSKVVTKVTINSPNATYGIFLNATTGTIKLQGWNGSAWVDLGSTLSVTDGATPNTTYTINYSGGVAYTKHRVLITSNYQCVSNITFYETPVVTPTSLYYTAFTSADQYNTSAWTDVNSATVTETLNSANAYYAVSFDNRNTFKVFTSGAWRAIASNLNSVHGGVDGTWYFRLDAGSWQVTSYNTAAEAISSAVASGSNNQMNGSALATISDTNWNASGGWTAGTLDVSVTLYTTNSANNPQVDNVAFNYDQSAQNMTMTLASFDVATYPSKIKMLAYVEPIDSLTLNTDIKAYVQEDVGQAFTQVNLVSTNVAATKQLFVGEVDITQPSAADGASNSGTSYVTSDMTAASTPSPNSVSATSEDSTCVAWKAFDQDTGSQSVAWMSASGTFNTSTHLATHARGYEAIMYDFGSGQAKAINKYRHQGRIWTGGGQHPGAWTLQGGGDSCMVDDDTGWTTLHTISGVSYPGDDTWSSWYTFVNSTAYRKYRIRITESSAATNQTFVAFGEIQFVESQPLGSYPYSVVGKITTHNLKQLKLHGVAVLVV